MVLGVFDESLAAREPFTGPESLFGSWVVKPAFANKRRASTAFREALACCPFSIPIQNVSKAALSPANLNQEVHFSQFMKCPGWPFEFRQNLQFCSVANKCKFFPALSGDLPFTAMLAQYTSAVWLPERSTVIKIVNSSLRGQHCGSPTDMCCMSLKHTKCLTSCVSQSQVMANT
jgi:hypothetical protein